MNDGFPHQGLSKAQRVSVVFHNFCYRSAEGHPFGGGVHRSPWSVVKTPLLVANPARDNNVDGKNQHDEKNRQTIRVGSTAEGWLTGTVTAWDSLTCRHASSGCVQVMKTSDTYLRFMVFNQGTSIYV